MPAAIAVPLISAGVGAGASIVGAKMASNASKHAADVQSQAAQQAGRISQQGTANTLAYLSNANAQAQNGYQPGPTLAALSGRMGVPSPQPVSVGSGATPMAMATRGGTMTLGQLGQAPQGDMVLLRAPNGQQRAVPRAQVAFYQSRGAQVVG